MQPDIAESDVAKLANSEVRGIYSTVRGGVFIATKARRRVSTNTRSTSTGDRSILL